MEINEELYKKLIDKDKRSQIYFYKYCFNVLMRVAIRYKKNKDDAAVLVNDSFLKILQNMNKYSRQKPLEPWLRRIAINTAIDDFRKNKNYKQIIEPVDTDAYSNTFRSDAPIDADLNLKELLNTINKLLPKATRLVFNLKAVDGYSHKEIAEKLGISAETSKWHVKQAKKILILNKHIITN